MLCVSAAFAAPVTSRAACHAADAPAVAARRCALSQRVACAGPRLPDRRARHACSSSRRSVACAAAAKKVLIVNTPSGAHAPLGFHLAKQLASSGHQVTVLTACAADSDKLKKAPFSYFGELVSAGVSTLYGEDAAATLPAGARYDTVVDNNGKSLDVVGPVIAAARKAGASQFLFISSAGVYKTGDELPHLEGDPVKADAEHVLVEDALRSGDMQWSSFRPQYLTGYGSNKDCEEWFFDRLARGRALPIPGSGVQLTCVAHAEDIAAMVACAVAQPQVAHGRIFNAVADRAISLDGMARLCAKVAGVEKPNIVHYDPKAAGVDVKKAFPFRPVHFYSEPRQAMALLGWAPKWTLEAALRERWDFFQASGRAKKDKAFELDDQVLAHLKK